MDVMDLRRRLMAQMVNNRFPSSIRLFGPVICSSKQLTFACNAPRQGFFIVVPDPIIRENEANELNQEIAFGIYNNNMYQSKYDSVPQNGTYTYRDQTIMPNGTLESWATGTTYVFDDNDLVVKNPRLIDGRNYYLVTIQTAEIFNQ